VLTICSHDFCQTVSGDQKSIDTAVLLIFRDNTSVDLRKTLDLNIRNRSLQVLELFIRPFAGLVGKPSPWVVDIDSDTGRLLVCRDCLESAKHQGTAEALTYAVADLQFGGHETSLDTVKSDFELTSARFPNASMEASPAAFALLSYQHGSQSKQPPCPKTLR
jgi:hypothetical protein